MFMLKIQFESMTTESESENWTFVSYVFSKMTALASVVSFPVVAVALATFSLNFLIFILFVIFDDFHADFF